MNIPKKINDILCGIVKGNGYCLIKYGGKYWKTAEHLNEIGVIDLFIQSDTYYSCSFKTFEGRSNWITMD